MGRRARVGVAVLSVMIVGALLSACSSSVPAQAPGAGVPAGIASLPGHAGDKIVGTWKRTDFGESPPDIRIDTFDAGGNWTEAWGDPPVVGYKNTYTLDGDTLSIVGMNSFKPVWESDDKFSTTYQTSDGADAKVTWERTSSSVTP
jgi:hypothetical protein